MQIWQDIPSERGNYMKKNRFGSIGAFQMAQMNKVCKVMRQDTLKKLRNMNVNYEISSRDKSDEYREHSKTILRG